MPKISVKEILRRSERRLMPLAETFRKKKIRADGFSQFLRIVALDRQAAAFFRSVVGKRGNDKMPVRFQRAAQIFQIKPTVFSFNQKMKNGAVVPQIVKIFR